MAAHDLPNLGLTGGFAEGEDGWGEAMNANLLKLSAIVQGGVLGRVDAVPADPADGDVYILTTDSTIAVRDAGAWSYLAPSEGWLIFDRETNEYLSFDGSAWVVLETGGGGGGLEDAPADGVPYNRQDNEWVPAESGGGGSGGGTGVRSARLHNTAYNVPADTNHKIPFGNLAMGDADMANPAQGRFVVPAGVNRVKLDLMCITGNDNTSSAEFYIFYFNHYSAAGASKGVVGVGGSESVFFGYMSAVGVPVAVEAGDYFECEAKIRYGHLAAAGAMKWGMMAWLDGAFNSTAVVMTQAEYNALPAKDANTIYYIKA